MTIYALSTGSVKSGIAIIRISGIQVENILLKITKKESCQNIKKLQLGKIYNHENNELN